MDILIYIFSQATWVKGDKCYGPSVYFIVIIMYFDTLGISYFHKVYEHSLTVRVC